MNLQETGETHIKQKYYAKQKSADANSCETYANGISTLRSSLQREGCWCAQFASETIAATIATSPALLRTEWHIVGCWCGNQTGRVERIHNWLSEVALSSSVAQRGQIDSVEAYRKQENCFKNTKRIRNYAYMQALLLTGLGRRTRLSGIAPRKVSRHRKEQGRYLTALETLDHLDEDGDRVQQYSFQSYVR